MVQLKVYPSVDAPVDSCVFLDLYETQPIKLTLSIEDITSADATSVFSRTFKVPATRDNNEFFENAWELDGIDFDITIKKPAEILVDGAEFKTGHVRLQKIFTNADQDKIDYELLFLGETRDFSSAIGEATMCQLQLTDFSWDGLPVSYSDSDDYDGAVNHTLVMNSWQAYPEGGLTDGVAGGNLLFPLIDHGNAYQGDSLNSPTITIGSAGGQQRSFTHSGVNDRLPAGRMKPMLRAKRLWDQIFENSGYTYESNFLDSEQFLHMYVSAFGNEETISIGVEQDSGGTFGGSASSQTFEYFEQPNGNNDVYSYLYLSNLVLGAPNYTVGLPDVGGAGDGSYYLAPGPSAIGGAYYNMEFGAQVDAQQEQSDNGYSPIDCAVQLCIVDAPGGNIVHTLATGNFTSNGNWSFGSWDSRNGGYQPQLDDIFQIFVTSNNGGYDISQVDQAYWKCLAAPGDYYPPRDLDCEYQQIDFIKDVITMFRLVMQPSVDRPNHFIVEPWKDFIGSGEVYDWSDKLIREKDFVSEPLFNTQSAQIEFTKQEDEDYINKFHQDNNKHAYGWLRFDSQNELLKGKREVEVLGIAPTPLDQIIDTQSSTSHTNPKFILPQIFEVDDDKRLPIKPKTRFLFYNGIVTTGGTTWYLSAGSGAQDYEEFDDYPLVSPYEYWPIENVVGPPPVNTLNLNFANDTRYFLDPDPNDYTTDAQGNLIPVPPIYSEIPNTLFETFWARYISSLYNKFSRRVTAYFTLNNVDLQTLTFDDIIFIDGKYYRPEKIIDAQIGERTAVKCELITVKDQRIVWRPEPLTGFSLIAQDGQCFGDSGSLQITTDGTPPFTWAIGDLSGGQPPIMTGTYNAPVGQAPYIFTIDNVPLGIDTVTVVDNFGRSAIASYEIEASTATPITTTWTETDATNCTSPNCNGSISVATPTGGTAPYTITWEASISGFNPTGLCPDDYRFYITDANGCQSDMYEASVSCSVTQNSFELREHLNNCSQLSAQTYIAGYSGSTQISQGDTVNLNEIRGCFVVMGSVQQSPNYTINQIYTDCETCNGGPTANSWLIRNCSDPNDERYLNYEDYNLQPGMVVTIQEPGNTACYEVIEASTEDMDWDADNIFTDCETCEGTDPGYQYFMGFCDQETSPYNLHSNIQLQLGDVVEVLNGPFAGRCVRVLLDNPGATTFGDLDTSTIYDDCTSCEGLDPQVCTTVNIPALAGAEISYEQNGNTFEEALLNGSYQRCGRNFQVISGTATFAPGTRLCTSNFDCAIRFKTSCHTLYGGNAGGSFEYQDVNGNWVLNQFVPQFQQLDVCAVINSVTVIGGSGQYTNNNSRCSSNDDCNVPTPGECEGYEISNDGGGVGNYNYTECGTGNTIEGALNPGESIFVCSTTVPNISGGLTVGISPVQC
jgi:hypothetical protein